MGRLNSNEGGLRALEKGDALALYEGAFRHQEVCRYLQWEPHPSLAETSDLVEEMLSLHRSGEKTFWILECSSRRIPIGLGSLRPDSPAIWLGFLVFVGEWGKGCGRALAERLISKCRQECFREARASINPLNQNSIGLLSSLSWQQDVSASTPEDYVMCLKLS